ncbi:BRCT domain-containing protein 4 [Elsinoe australis]|uniref:BRCT domain-containing protein 4 n=1 Tax=Elsinoe australis TaxID=40998 RepID=A0A4U7AUJ7_9PEZI|nr:BRCT domain-containing protein 4 [Elsinoe australis]
MADGDAQKPLYGVVLCGTSLSQDVRSHVNSTGSELGATHKLDLTTDVTHLLCGSVASDKYRHVARHRPDIHVLRPEWLFAIRDAWMEGGDVDVKAITEQYRLPTFHSLNICLTGFTDVKQRQWLQNSTTQNGAKYHPDLTKEVTHLVTAKPEGAKYDRAKIWGIKTVSLSWFKESIKRGLILNEVCFDPLVPDEQQGKGAFEPRIKKSDSGKRLRPEDDDTQTSNAKRKMRRTASTRLNSQSQTLWGDLSVNEDSEAGPLDDSWTQPVDPGKDVQQTIETQPVEDSLNKSRPSLSRNASSDHSQKGLFSGWICMPHGHENPTIDKRVRQYLTENGAIIAANVQDLESADLSCKALILPAKWIANPPDNLPKTSADIHLLTEWWVERSIFRKKALEPEKDMLSNALLDLPKDCFKDVVASTSGLGNDIRYVATIVKAAGGKYEEDLVRSTNVLIHNLSKSDLEKPVYCADRNIDVVTPEWLFESLRLRETQPRYPFFLPNEVCTAIYQIRDRRRKEAQKKRAAGARPQGVDQGQSKDLRASKKPTAPRMSGFKRQSHTPALPLARISATTTVKTQPMKRLTPLEEISQNSNERLKSQPTPDAFDDDPAPVPITLDEQPAGKENDTPVTDVQSDKPTEPVQSLGRAASDQADEFVSDFLARRQNSGSLPQEKLPKGRRKLGRAPSGNTTGSFIKPSASPFIEEEGSVVNLSEAPMPSQQITYEVPGAAEHRRLMSKKMGTTFEEEGGRRVEGLGTVKDVDSTKAVGERVRGRHRDTR